MKRFLLFNLIPVTAIYVVAVSLDILSGVSTDRIFYIIVFNFVFIWPLCYIISFAVCHFKYEVNIKKGFISGVLLAILLPNAAINFYSWMLGSEIEVQKLLLSAIFFAALSCIIIIPGMALVACESYLRKIGNMQNYNIARKVKTILYVVFVVILCAEAYLGILCIASADEWSVPEREYEILVEFSNYNFLSMDNIIRKELLKDEHIYLAQITVDNASQEIEFDYEKISLGDKIIHYRVYADIIEKRAVRMIKTGNSQLGGTGAALSSQIYDINLSELIQDVAQDGNTTVRILNNSILYY